MRPWLYRIARNRSLNHLRRTQAVGVDSMDVHLSEGGATTADKVHKREEFRLLVADVQDLPETQRTALLLREIDALSYEQIAEAMETTVPSVKSLLVRARVSLAEAAEARLLTCEEVRDELGEVAEGLRAHDRAGAPPPAHVRPLHGVPQAAARRPTRRSPRSSRSAPLLLLKKTLLAHLGTTAAAGGGTAAAAGGAAAGGAAARARALQAGFGAIATKTAAGLAAAAIVTAGAVEVKHAAHAARAPRHGRRQVAPRRRAPAADRRADAAPVAGRLRAAADGRAQRRAPRRRPTRTPATAKKPTPTPTTTATATADRDADADRHAAPPTEQHDGDTTTLPTDTHRLDASPAAAR